MASRIVPEGGFRVGAFKPIKIVSRSHLAFVRKLPCIACLCEGVVTARSQAAHVRYSCAEAGKVNPGLMGRPGDDKTVPLCARHHLVDQHGGSERAFWLALRVDPLQIAEMLWEMTGQLEAARAALVRRFRGG